MKKFINTTTVNIAISIMFMLFFCVTKDSNSLIWNLCDGFFILGLIYLCIALIIHVRNLGLFKSFSYFKYRRTKNAMKKECSNPNDPSQLPESFNNFYNYIENKYSTKWGYKLFYMISIPCLTLSLVLLLVLM